MYVVVTNHAEMIDHRGCRESWSRRLSPRGFETVGGGESRILLIL